MTTAVRESESVTATGEIPIFFPNEGIASVMRHAKRARAAGDLARACSFYSHATDLDPNSAEAWAGRASTTSNLDEAIMAWGYAVALAPNDEACSMLNACVGEKIKKSAEDVRSLVNLGRRLAEASQRLAAHRLLKRATELDESNEQAWVWRAGVAGDYAESVECLQRALALNPWNERAKAGLEWAQARFVEASPSPKDAEQAALVLEEGQREFQSGDRARAYERFTHATEIDPKNELAWFWRGSTAPDNDQALVCMDRVLALNPENEAAKDARWWLRVQKLREHVPAPASPSAAQLSLEPYVDQFANKKRDRALFWMASGTIVLLIGIFALLIAIVLTGHLT